MTTPSHEQGAGLRELIEEARDHADALTSAAWRRTDGGQELCLAAILLNRLADALSSSTVQGGSVAISPSEIASPSLADEAGEPSKDHESC